MKEKVAIIGMGCVYPEASNIYEYWNNIYTNKNINQNTTVIELDSKECDFVADEIESNSIEKVFSLITAKEALFDAKIYDADVSALDKDRIGVIMSVSQNCDMCNSRKNTIVNSIMQKFDFKGISSTLSGTKTNSLASVKFAIDELHDMNADVMLAGEVNTEGVGIVVLKRLDDAKRDRNKIYATIKGIGTSSEGTYHNSYQVSKQSKMNLYNKIYEKINLSPLEVGLLETNGTGKDTIDISEFSSLSDVYSRENLRRTVIGSVKNENDFLNTTSSMASLIKVALSLYQEVLPASIYEEDVEAMIQGTSLCTIAKTRPWLINDNNPKRYGAINAFEESGANFHIVLEEDKKESVREESWTLRVHGVMFSGVTKEELVFKIEELFKGLKINSNMWLQDRYRYQANKYDKHRLSFVARSSNEVMRKCIESIKLLNELEEDTWCKNSIIYSCQDRSNKKVAVLFGGQSIQKTDMLLGLLKHNSIVKEYIKRADNVMLMNGKLSISDLLYSLILTDREKNEVKDKLKDIENIEPIIVTLQSAIYGAMKDRGLKVNYFIGHSFSEITALWADGAFDYETCIEAASKRGEYISSMYGNTSMLNVYTTIEVLKTYIYKYDNVYIANVNSNREIVVSGNANELEILMDELKLVGIMTSRIESKGAYHSPYMVQAAEAFGNYLNNKRINIPKGKAISSYSGRPYGSDVINTLVEQIINPVLYKDCIENAYDEGVRTFVEIGCKDDIYGITKDIIESKKESMSDLYTQVDSYNIISIYLDDEDDEYNFEYAFAQLAVYGINVKEEMKEYIHNKGEIVKELELNCSYNTTNENPYIEEITLPKQVVIKNNLRSVDTLQTEAFTKYMDAQNYQINAITKMLESNKDKSDEAQKNIIDCISKFRENSLDAFKIYFGEKQGRVDESNVVWSEVISEEDEDIVMDNDIKAIEDKSKYE